MNSETPPPPSSPKPVRFAWLTFYAALISFLGGGWIWFSAAFIWPRIQGWVRMLPVPQAWIDQVRSHQRFAEMAWWIVCGLTLLLLALSLLRRAKLQAFCRTWLLIQAPLVVLGSGLLSVQAFILLMTMRDSDRLETRLYKSQFHASLIKDTLRGDADAGKGMRPLTGEEISHLSESDREDRFSCLRRMLKGKPEAPAAKRILATMSTLRIELSLLANESSVIVVAANTITGQAMRQEKVVIDWVNQHIGKDGWDPLPLYDISILEDRKKDRPR